MNEQIFQTPLNRRSRAAEFRARALKSLKGRWALAIGVFILAAILCGTGSSGAQSVSFNTSSTNVTPIFQDPAIADKTVEEIFSAVLSSALVKSFLLFMIGGVSLAFALTLFVGAPVSVGYAQFNLDLHDGKETGVGKLFSPFSTCYWRSVGVRGLLMLISTAISVCMLIACGAVSFVLLAPSLASMSMEELQNLVIQPSAEEVMGFAISILGAVFAVFAVMIVFAVISIVITYRYALVTYILAEYPEMSAMDVLRNSARLMKGNKWRLFCLQFSFIGWILLASCCTCGIGLLWVTPYMNAATAAFYDEVSERARAREVEFPSIDPEDYFSQNQ